MHNNNLADKLYFSKEAAEFLGISVQRLNRLVQDGKIKPLKKNSSGAIYHHDELVKRKETLEIFQGVQQGGENGMFQFDNGVKTEALNYSVLMNVMNCTEKKLEPLFERFAEKYKVDVPMIEENFLPVYADFFSVDVRRLSEEYLKAYQCFLSLKDTDEIIKRGSREYPPLLAKTKEAPRFLYVRGKKSLLLEERTVALVGSRQASEKSKNNTKRLTDALGKNGITIVSGLAKGIDVSAHKEALDMGFNTIAVIGTNLNQYYPNENKEVQLDIEKKGLVVSQFSPAMQTQRWHFPLRNGVMSGLSLATVIMEAGETSGALKQADFALKQGRQIMIPESALKLETISWPAKYVKRGATVVQKPSDVLKKLAENNIFQVESEPVQQDIMSYCMSLEKQQSVSQDENDIKWSKTLLVEG